MAFLKRVYLAAPYRHASEGIKNQRCKHMAIAAAHLMLKHNVCVFAPILHGRPIAQAMGNTEFAHSWEFWEKQDYAHLITCQELVVLKLPQWEKSEGVTAEIAYAEKLGMPISYWDWIGPNEEDPITGKFAGVVI